MIILWNTDTLYIEGRYAAVRGAKGARTRLIAKEYLQAEKVIAGGFGTPREPNEYSIGTMEDYNAADYEVERVNCVTGKTFKIMWSNVGGPCDPSTENYHSS